MIKRYINLQIYRYYGVAWSVSRSVCLLVHRSVTIANPTKRLNRSRCCLGCGLCIRWGAHWRHLTNRTEPYMCGSDAVLRQITLTTIVIRPHRSTTYVDAAYSYRPSSVVCRPSVCLSVCHTSQPCNNGCTDRAAVWVEDLSGPGEPCIRWGSRFPHEKGQIFRGEWASNCKV